MIKAISFLRPTASSAACERVSAFLSAMGLAGARGWQVGGCEARSVAAPRAKLEVLNGAMNYPSDVYIEVTSVDAAYQAAEEWLRKFGGEAGLKRLSPIEETDWKARIFSVEPEQGFPLCFWSWSDPEAGRLPATEGDLSAVGMKFGIVVARWNAVITDRLLDGAMDALRRSGAERQKIEVVRVPGAWEIAAAARTLAKLGKVDAIITLGCLLRGETAHYEAIYNEVARGIGQSQQETGIPHAFGVLTCETLEQALNRAGIKAGNKGYEAAIAAIEMVSLKGKLEGGQA